MTHATHRGFLGVRGGAGQHASQCLVELAQRGGLHTIQRGDAQNHVIAQPFAELLEDRAGVIEFQMHQNRGDDLRVFVADQVGSGGRVHPLQPFDAGGIVAGHDAADDAGGAFIAQRLGEHGLDGFVVDGDRRAFGRLLRKFVEHGFDAFAGDLFQFGHRLADFLHFARAEIFQHFGGFVFAQREQQNRAFFDAFASHCCCHPPSS
jgi:hypothetical protein